jgi:hypothetical protein
VVAAAAVDASLRPPAPATAVRGRDRELAVLEGLRRGRGMAVVCGAGGLGKTTLAAEAAQRAQQAGQAVFWTRWQDDPHRLAQDLTRIAEALGLPPEQLEQARQGRAVLVDVVWEQLESVDGWVVVVDNVDTPARVGPGPGPPPTKPHRPRTPPRTSPPRHSHQPQQPRRGRGGPRRGGTMAVVGTTTPPRSPVSGHGARTATEDRLHHEGGGTRCRVTPGYREQAHTCGRLLQRNAGR